MDMSGNAMFTSGMTPAEAVLVADRDRDRDGWFGGDGGCMWIFFLFFLLARGGNGFGFGHGGVGSTGNFINNDFLYTNLKNTMDNGFMQTANQNFAIQKDLWQTSTDTKLQLAQLGYQQQNCCCETNRNIDAVRYENAKNTCDITTAIHAEGEATRALINANTMQDLRDRLEARDRELMTANFQLSQQAQSANLVRELRPCPIPAYPSCSPYAVTGWGGYGYGYGGDCGCGCGCGR